MRGCKCEIWSLGRKWEVPPARAGKLLTIIITIIAMINNYHQRYHHFRLRHHHHHFRHHHHCRLESPSDECEIGAGALLQLPTRLAYSAQLTQILDIFCRRYIQSKYILKFSRSLRYCLSFMYACSLLHFTRWTMDIANKIYIA